MKTREIAIGIDMGGTNTVFGFVNKRGKCIAQGSIRTEQYEELNDFLKALWERIEEVRLEIKQNIHIKGIGIGAPNGNFYNGTIEFAPNLNWKGIIPFAKEFKKLSKLPVVLTNDANAAALGEMMYGGAKRMKDFILITLGTGLGSGIVVNGNVLYGHDGFAGEIGHVIVVPNGRKCGCGRKGCLETYASATGIKRTALNLLSESDEESMLSGHTIRSLSAKMIDAAAIKGDKVAMDSFEYTGKILGEALANSIAYTSPKAIFLFGGLAQAGKLIFKPTKKYMERSLLHVYKKKVKLLPSSLEGAHAAVLGASALVWKEIS
ncbi:MAG: ROK family protein [Bacteroidetes bacterium]|nr:ROK family protein [Bacteroidota bacterium]MBL6963651.1 ROK family protein [Bacteroidota bacterium]